jgi:hypothetical protein
MKVITERRQHVHPRENMSYAIANTLDE